MGHRGANLDATEVNRHENLGEILDGGATISSIPVLHQLATEATVCLETSDKESQRNVESWIVSECKMTKLSGLTYTPIAP